ncbi:MAG: hypothetical protein ACE5EV_07045, partial [Gaiellales bacterium]
MIDTDLVKQPPRGYATRPNGSVALLVFLHGIGEVGGDRSRHVKMHGPWRRCLTNAPALEAVADLYVVGPHLTSGDWDAGELIERLERFLRRSPRIDRSRIYVSGLSLGGLGALMLGLETVRRAVDSDTAGEGFVPAAIACFCPAERHF